ncbi:MAG TPA: SdiA-regulated domain-containing protein, partial [Gemmatimonadales bacterium]|nr:SdiA-regulated domain-containing protein [Gemmatimonadales bacterium]
ARFEARLRRATASPAADSASRGRAAPLARWRLPQVLREISGLALTPDGRLLTHGDERGIITEIDYRRGVVTKQFLLGASTLEADLEGIAVAGDRVYLVTSAGAVYEAREGRDGERVSYLVQDTGVGAFCEVEGLAHDPRIDALLLACKNVRAAPLRDSLVIFRWRLDGPGETRLSRLTVPLAAIAGRAPWEGDEFHASGIEYHPGTGRYLLIAAQERGLVELTPEGRVVRVGRLPEGLHRQAEGITITRDGVVIVSDEGNRRPAAITLYAPGDLFPTP